MSWLARIAGVIAAVGLVAVGASAAIPTRLTLTAPAAAGIGEEILLEARLSSADGRPIGGARLELRQVGAVGQRKMAEATTGPDGTASFVHREYSIPALTLRVAFGGSGAQGPAQADASVAVSGIELRPSVVMAHTPPPLVKGVLFLLLGTVWLTYLYAASRIAAVARDRTAVGR